MTALKIVGIVLLILLLLSFTRVGAVVDFGGEPRVRLRVGPITRTLLPKKEKKKENADEQPSAEKKAPKERKKRTLPKLTRSELRDLAETAFGALRRTLRRTCRRTRIDPLEVGVVFAGSDPADTAQTYGYANAALWAVMPELEELFHIPKPSICLGMDFDRTETRAEGTVGVSLRVCDLIAIALTLALPVGRWLRRYRRAHRNDARTEPPTKGAGSPETNETEKLTA